jgi:hypothetical protein
VLITDDGRACVTDVGIYTSVIQTIRGHRIPIPPQWPYKSSEELLNGVQTSHTDVYSFACTVYSVSWILSTRFSTNSDVLQYRCIPAIALSSAVPVCMLDIYREAMEGYLPVQNQKD